MHKIVIHRPGDTNRLSLEESPSLTPQKNELIVAVRASGVNFADVIIRKGLYSSAKEFVGWPITPGFEFSGVVKETGPEVSRFCVGQKVFGVSLFNAYASEVAVPENQVFALPEKMNFEQAAAFPAVFLTAYHGLFQNVVVKPGMKALVHSAAGGVGGALVQLCKIAGIQTCGVVGGSHKVEPLQALGCDFVIDKSKENLWDRVKSFAPEGADLVFDANGVETLKQSYENLAPCGKLMVYGFHSMFSKNSGRVNWPKLALKYLRTPKFNPLEMTSANKSVVAFNLSYLFNRKDLLRQAMGDLIGWIEEGKVKSPPVKTVAMADVGQAHRLIESGNTVGKLVLIP